MASPVSRKKPTSVRLSAEAREILDDLSARLQISKTAVLEVALREKAWRELAAGGNATEAATSPAPPAVDPEWQTGFGQLLEKAQRNAAASGLSPEELEREVTLAREEVRELHRARRS